MTSKSNLTGLTFAPAELGAGAIKSHRLWHLGSALSWASFDALIACSAMVAAFILSPAYRVGATGENHLTLSTAAAIWTMLAFFGSHALGLSHYPNLRSNARIIVLIILYVAAIAAATMVVVQLVLYKQIGRYILGIASAIVLALSLSARLLWYVKLKQAVHRVVLLGADRGAEPIVRLLGAATFPIKVVAQFPEACVAGNDLDEFLRGEDTVHEVLVNLGTDIPAHILLATMDRGIAVSTIDAFSERHFYKISSAFLNCEWFFQIDLKRYHPFYTSAKATMDIMLALLGGVVSLPLLLVAMMLIKMTSVGPVFYSQTRMGLGQKPFKIWKLRTMRIDSEISGPQWAKERDPRVTAIGRVLRKTRLDEVPQFWNILRGEMSFVGPRPERPEFVERLAATIPFYRQRHLVKPGLTGWAQICYTYGASEDDAREKLGYDLYYLKNASLFLDIQIMLQTIGAIARGAR